MQESPHESEAAPPDPRRETGGWLAALALGVVGLQLHAARFHLLGPLTPPSSFGQTVVFIAIALLGPVKASLTLAISLLEIVVRTGLTGSAAVLTLEAVGTYVVWRRNRSLAYSAVVYWVLVGWVFEALICLGIMGITLDYTVLLIARALLTGIANALVADAVFLVGWRLRRITRIRPPLPLAEYAFPRLVLLVLAPSLALTIADGRWSNINLQATTDRDLTAQAEKAAAEIETSTLLRQEKLTQLGYGLVASGSNPARRQGAIESFHREHPEFLNLALSDTIGKLVLSSPPTNVTGRDLTLVSLASRPYWQEAKATLRPSYGPFTQGRLQIRERGPEPVLPGAIPLVDAEGRFAGAILATLDARWIGSGLPRIEDTALTLLDEGGHVIASQANLAVGAPIDLPTEGQGTQWLGDTRVFSLQVPGTDPMTRYGLNQSRLAVTNVTRAGWRVAAGRSAAAIFHASAVQTGRSLSLLVATTSLLLLLARRLTSAMGDPLATLGGRARRLVAGEAQPGDPGMTAYAELEATNPVEEVHELVRHLRDNEVRTRRALQNAEEAAKQQEEEIRRAVRAANEAEQELQFLIDSVDVILFRLDATHMPTFVSASAERILGFPPADWLADRKFWGSRVHPDDRETAVASYWAVVGKGGGSFECRFIARDGRVVWMRTQVIPGRDRKGKDIFLGTMVDLTDAKNAAETDAELRRLLEQAAVEWEETFDTIPAAVAVLDGADTIVRANRAALALMKREAPVALSELAAAEPWKTMAALTVHARSQKEAVEQEATDHEGHRIYSVLLAARDVRRVSDGRQALLLTARDVTTERETTAQRLFLTNVWSALAGAADLNEAAAVILEHLCSYVGWDMGQLWIVTPDGSHLECLSVWFESQPGFERFHEVSRGRIFERGEGSVGRVWEEGRHRLLDHFADEATPDRGRVAAELGINFQLAMPVRAGANVVAVVELFRRHPKPHTSMAIKEAAVAQLGASIERYRAQMALRERERSHAMLLSNLSGMAYRILIEGKNTTDFVSEGCRQLTGYSPEALRLGSPSLNDLIHPDERDSVLAHCDECFAAHLPSNSEYRIVTAAGEERWVWDQCQGVYSGDGKLLAVEGFMSDISARKRAESELQKASTMIAMGELVAGVAHEVRNPLFAISANFDAFEARFGDQEQFREFIEAARGEVERLISLMNDLLDYGRPTAEEFAAGSLSSVVAQAVRSSAPAAHRARIEVRNRVGGKLPAVLLDRRRLVQVFHNLLENSIQHTPAGGQIEIDAMLEGKTIICTVGDTGSGILPEHLSRLFDPFFSRRRGGTGLGLAIVQRIVHEHGGSIRARNRASKGAEMELRFPIAAPLT
jgi:PAS domain S-box-containing protein